MNDVPALVPARMLNEFTYCPRLFFLEWVQARFADNEDTVEGQYQHRAAEEERGRAPLPDDGELLEARSVLLSSPQLGLVARVDIIEGDGGEVRPVDIKKGSPPDTPEHVWEPERLQLCAQGLLLAEAGYRCTAGVIYFAAARRRVVVEFDDQLIARTHQLLEELKLAAANDLAPPPLIDSPKCPRCSLVGICLPDETNMLMSRTDRPPRRLLPKDSSRAPLYIIEHGATLGFKSNRFEVRKDGEIADSVRAIDVSQVCIYGNVQITTQAFRELFAREAPVLWFSHGGWFYGMAEGLPSKHVELRRHQVAASGLGGFQVARKIVEAKIRNCRTILRRNLREPRPAVLASLKDLASEAREAVSAPSLLGMEGAAARLYFEAFPLMLRPEVSLPGATFSFEGGRARARTRSGRAYLAVVDERQHQRVGNQRPEFPLSHQVGSRQTVAPAFIRQAEKTMRRRYVVAYDIREPKRLRRVHKAMKAFGYPLQYSVFICDLDNMEKIQLRLKVGEIMSLAEDSLALIDLGDPESRGVECFEFLGMASSLPKGGPRIV